MSLSWYSLWVLRYCDEHDILTEVNTIIMRVPFNFGFNLEQDESSLHCILQKKALPYITKLRAVQLFEVDFKSCLKYLYGVVASIFSKNHGVNGN